jgi:hypothetical protein
MSFDPKQLELFKQLDDQLEELAETFKPAVELSFSHKVLLRERLNYLATLQKHDWDLEENRDSYLEGFEDAMRTLGLKP